MRPGARTSLALPKPSRYQAVYTSMDLSRVSMKLFYNNAGTSSLPSQTHAATRLASKCWKLCLLKLIRLGITTLVPFGAKPERSPPCWILMYAGLGRLSTAIFYNLYGSSRFSTDSSDAERRDALRHCISLATAYRGHTLTGSRILLYDFSCFMCLLHNVTRFCISGAAAQPVRDGGGWTQHRKKGRASTEPNC